jgi:[ribosomal protein S5]-alanine N-acetyltransferase
MVPYFLTSARLGFRCWTRNDFPLAMELWGDSEVTALIGGPFSPEMVRAKLMMEIDRMGQFGAQYWPIFHLIDDQFVGCAGLRPYLAEEKVYELGFHLCRPFWKHGLAREAAVSVIDYAFSSLGADAIFAGHHPANETSRKLLMKLGFVFTHDELYEPTGLLHPSYKLRKP